MKQYSAYKIDRGPDPGSIKIVFNKRAMGDKNSSDVEILNNIVYLYRKVIFDLNFIDISSEWLLLLALLKKKALQEHGRVSFLHINPTVEKLACALCVETIVVEG